MRALFLLGATVWFDAAIGCLLLVAALDVAVLVSFGVWWCVSGCARFSGSAPAPPSLWTR